MGYDGARAELSARLSSHNSEQDARDRTRWNELATRLRALEAEFQDIDLIVSVDDA